MKEYLKENISFNKLLFSTSITVFVLISGSSISYVLNENHSSILLLILALGLVVSIAILVSSILIYFQIKDDLIKLKSYE